jgi:hypothetical protein
MLLTHAPVWLESSSSIVGCLLLLLFALAIFLISRHRWSIDRSFSMAKKEK